MCIRDRYYVDCQVFESTLDAMLDFIVRLAVFADEQKSTSAGCSGRCGEAYHRAGKRLYFFRRRFQHIDTRFRNSAVVGRPSCNEGLSEKELSGRDRLKSVPWDREDRFGRSCFADGSFHASCGSRLQRDLPQFVLFEMRSHFCLLYTSCRSPVPGSAAL